jgi:putative transposase
MGISVWTRCCAPLPTRPRSRSHENMVSFAMPRYRRAEIEGGTFFFTVVVADRSSDILVSHVDRFRRVYGLVQERHPFRTVAICILPDHLHAIWSLPEGDADYSLRWRTIKSNFSRGLDGAGSRSPSKIAKRDKGLWQRRYWEHAIRDDADLGRHIDYIHFNPVKHGYVSRVSDWPYSSFRRYVAKGDLPLDWGGDGRELGSNFGE